MKFYRAREDRYDYLTHGDVVENELLTEKERNSIVRYLPDYVFEVVDISKKGTYWSFGRRFEYKASETE